MLPPGQYPVVVQAVDLDVALWSLLALLLFLAVGLFVARDANANGVARPGIWGGAVFLAMMLGTLFVDRQLLGAAVAGLFVIGLYIAVARG